ncbi:MAG: asparagine synthase-related protein [Syntrophales bacterium]
MIISDISLELKKRFAESVDRNRTEGILLSGGLDSSLAAAYAKGAKAISIGLESYGEDKSYSARVADFLGIDYLHVTVTVEDAIAAIPEVIKILKSFDPALPNDLPVYLGLKLAKDKGIRSMMTGDGSDEIFAGYDFMLKMKDLEQYMKRMHSAMQFSSNKIGEAFGIEIRQPFLDREFMGFSQEIPLDLKVRRDGNKPWGKWILREAFAGVLPPELLWQGKRPLEYGSGMTELRRIIPSMVSDEEFAEGKDKFPIKFWNKEHFYYYHIYREVVGEIPAPQEGEKICNCCGTGMDSSAFHCKLCGEVTEWKTS